MRIVILLYLKVCDDYSFHFISFLILDLPKLHTISFNGSHALEGDMKNKILVNASKEYNNTLIMKSMKNSITTGCYLNRIDLPSLATICCQKSKSTHQYIGHVILESMIRYNSINMI